MLNDKWKVKKEKELLSWYNLHKSEIGNILQATYEQEGAHEIQ